MATELLRRRACLPVVTCLCILTVSGCGAGSVSVTAAAMHSSPALSPPPTASLSADLTASDPASAAASSSATAAPTPTKTATATATQSPAGSQQPSSAAMPAPLVMQLWVDGKPAPVNTDLKFTRAVGQHMTVRVRWTDGEGADVGGGSCRFEHLCGDHIASPSAQCSADPSSGGEDDQTVFTERGTYHYDYAVVTSGCRSGREVGHVSIDIAVPAPRPSPSASSSAATVTPTTTPTTTGSGSGA